MTATAENKVAESIIVPQDIIPPTPRRKRDGQTSEDRALILREVLEDKQAEDVLVLDLRGRSLLSDFFLICTGTSSVQLRAIANGIMEKVDDGDLPKPRIEGQQVGEWILMDFADVVVHLMDQASRERYKLEQFWTSIQPKGALMPLDGEEEDEDEDEEFDEDETDDEDDLDEDDLDGDLDDLDEDEDDEDLEAEFEDDEEDEEDEDAAYIAGTEKEVEPIDESENDVPAEAKAAALENEKAA